MDNKKPAQKILQRVLKYFRYLKSFHHDKQIPLRSLDPPPPGITGIQSSYMGFKQFQYNQCLLKFIIKKLNIEAETSKSKPIILKI